MMVEAGRFAMATAAATTSNTVTDEKMTKDLGVMTSHLLFRV
jgi:hypothetical protein